MLKKARGSSKKGVTETYQVLLYEAVEELNIRSISYGLSASQPQEGRWVERVAE